jgi:Restriction endonuclease
MKVRVFGADNEDKGSQLERLTKRLLESRGYRQVVLNSIGSGGTEIDIVAEQTLPGLNRHDSVEVIGECKAYDPTVSQPALMKFLGKLWLLKTKRKNHVKGIFVALSGVNGAFDGAYRDFSESDNSVELVTGDNLAEQLIREFNLPGLQVALQKIGQQTSDVVVTSSLGYYDLIVYWIFEFANSTFTVLGGPLLDFTPPDNAIQIMAAQLQSAHYRDLKREQSAINRRIIARKFVLGQCLCGRSIELPKDHLGPFFSQFALEQADLESARNDLEREGIVTPFNGGFRLSDLQTDLDKRRTVIKEMLTGTILLDFVDTDEWEAMIDDALLSDCLQMQGNLTINADERKDFINLMKWSPQALLWSLVPDQLLTRPPENEAVAGALAPERARWYRSQMINYALTDFQGAVAAILFKRYGLVELQSSRRIAFKTNERLELEMQVTDRFRLARYTSGDAPQNSELPLVQVWLTQNQPEPWERSESRVESERTSLS